MHQLVTDQGVLRLGPDGVLEIFRDVDGRSASRLLLWGCDAVVHDPTDSAGPTGPDETVRLLVTRKGLPVVSVTVPGSERAEAEAMAAVVRAWAQPI